MSRLPLYTDEITINDDGTITGWACALNDHLDAGEPLQECAAPRGECPRLFQEAFECRRK